MPVTVYVDIFPPKAPWSYRVPWDKNKEDIGQLWSKILTRMSEHLVANGCKVSGSGIGFSSLDESSRVENEDDLMSCIQSAIDGGDPKIQLRAIVQVRTNVAFTRTDRRRHLVLLCVAHTALLSVWVAKRPTQMFGHLPHVAHAPGSRQRRNGRSRRRNGRSSRVLGPVRPRSLSQSHQRFYRGAASPICRPRVAGQARASRTWQGR